MYIVLVQYILYTVQVQCTIEVCKSDPNPIRSDFGTKIILDRIDKVVS